MGYESAYDVLLDDFDEGLKADDVRTVFDELKRELVPLIAQIAGARRPGRRLVAARGLPDREAAGDSRSRSSSGSASTTRAGGSTRPCTRSR